MSAQCLSSGQIGPPPPPGPCSHLCHHMPFPSLDVEVHQNVRTDLLLPGRALSHPAVLQSQRAPCLASSASKWTQKDKWRANITQICTYKNSPAVTAAQVLDGSSNRWLRLSDFPIPEVVPLCFPSISFPGTWFWQAVGPLESTVSFKVIPEWCSNRGQPTCYPEWEAQSYRREPCPKHISDLERTSLHFNKVH